MKVSTRAEKLFFATARLEWSTEAGEWSATAFLYRVPVEGGYSTFLVTNRHVVANAQTLLISMIAARPDGSPALGVPLVVNWEEFADAWSAHPDPAIDVAVIPFSEVLNGFQKQGKLPAYSLLTPTDALTAVRAADLDALEDVVFVGYPNGLYDTTNLLPIARRGMTATPIAVDYEGRAQFLIDAAVFPGSSGSPVFLLDRGMHPDRTGRLSLRGRFMLLGVLAAVHTRRVEGRVREVEAALGVEFDEPLGLGIVFRAETIEGAITPALERFGMPRA